MASYREIERERRRHEVRGTRQLARDLPWVVGLLIVYLVVVLIVAL